MCMRDNESAESQNFGLSLINVFAVVSVITLFWKLPSGEQTCVRSAFLKIKCGNIVTTLFLLLC